MNATDPIGFFDSGLGGISILRTTLALMPGEDFLYYGDSNHAPYGVRSAGEILELSRGAVRFLLERNAKAVVIACNTATAAAGNNNGLCVSHRHGTREIGRAHV